MKVIEGSQKDGPQEGITQRSYVIGKDFLSEDVFDEIQDAHRNMQDSIEIIWSLVYGSIKDERTISRILSIVNRMQKDAQLLKNIIGKSRYEKENVI